MSRNGHFRLHSPMMANRHMGTAYGPSAEGSAEGDVLYGLREDDASLRLGVSAYDLQGLREDDAGMRLGVSAYDLEGLREDDANLRLAGLREDDAHVRLAGHIDDTTQYDGATGRAEGSAEGHAVSQLGGANYTLVSNGRMGGLREDDAAVRLGVSAYDLEGLREDDANLRLAGLREDDAAVRLGDMSPTGGQGAEGRAEGSAEGTRTQELGVSAYDLDGLREDDAAVRLGVSAYDLQGLREESEDIELSGLREDDAMLRLGISAYDQLGAAYAPDAQGAAEGDQSWDEMGISAYDLGDVDSLNAEAAAIEQEQTLGDHEIGKKKGMGIRMVARAAAREAYMLAKEGKIGSLSEAEKLVKDRVAVAVARLKTGAAKADEVAADAVSKAVAHFGPKIKSVIAKRVSVSGLRMGYILRGLREDDASVRMGVSAYDEMGRRRARWRRPGPRKFMKGAEETPPSFIGAEGFHERFPVTVDIAGIGVIHGLVKGSRMGGLFDFLTPLPSDAEYLAQIRITLQGWDQAWPRLQKLHPTSKDSIVKTMEAVNNEPAKYETLRAFLAEGSGAKSSGRWDRVKRLNAYLPTVQNLISTAEALGPGAVMTPAQATDAAVKDLNQRIDAAGKSTFLQDAAPVAAGVGVAGLFTALLIALA